MCEKPLVLSKTYLGYESPYSSRDFSRDPLANLRVAVTPLGWIIALYIIPVRDVVIIENQVIAYKQA